MRWDSRDVALLAGNMFDDRGDDKVNRRNALVVLKGVEGIEGELCCE